MGYQVMFHAGPPRYQGRQVALMGQKMSPASAATRKQRHHQRLCCATATRCAINQMSWGLGNSLAAFDIQDYDCSKIAGKKTYHPRDIEYFYGKCFGPLDFALRVCLLCLTRKFYIWVDAWPSHTFHICQNHLFNMCSSNLQQFPADGLEISPPWLMMALKTNSNWPASGLISVGAHWDAPISSSRIGNDGRSINEKQSLGRLIPWLSALELHHMGYLRTEEGGSFWMCQTWRPHGSTSSRLSLVSRCFAVPKWPWITWIYYASYQ